MADITNERLLNEDVEKIESRITEIEGLQDHTGLRLEEMNQLKKDLKKYSSIQPEDFTQGIINLLIDKIYAEPIGTAEDRTMSLKIVLNTGESRRRMYSRTRTHSGDSALRSDNLFLTI